jgi:hypothetical protein
VHALEVGRDRYWRAYGRIGNRVLVWRGYKAEHFHWLQITPAHELAEHTGRFGRRDILWFSRSIRHTSIVH